MLLRSGLLKNCVGLTPRVRHRFSDAWQEARTTFFSLFDLVASPGQETELHLEPGKIQELPRSRFEMDTACLHPCGTVGHFGKMSSRTRP